MKKGIITRILLFLLISMPLIFVACSDDKENFIEGDTTELRKDLVVGYDSLNAAKPENFTESSISEFKSKLDLISSIIDEQKLSQQEVVNLNVHLNQSALTFENSRMYGISSEYLLGGWDFSEADGSTSLLGKGERGLVANLKSGAQGIFGSTAAYPQFINQGINGRAIYLNNGAYLSIDKYNPNEFLGKQLTIAVWVKPDVIKGGNYIASLNDWHNWKFQLQDQAKAFFTVATTAGITDSDNERDLTAPVNTWTHLVLVLDLDSQSPLRFYTNGVLTKAWNTAQKPALTGAQASLTTQIPLLIGAAVEYENDWGEISPNSWSYFQGALDEIQFYNTAVSDGQVRWLYNQEAPLLEE